MLYSMTGYGRAEEIINDKTFLIEIKSLNGKQYDMRLSLPSLLKPYEFDIRNCINEGLVRGSIECFIILKQNGAEKPVTVNTSLLKAYFAPISNVSKELGLSTDNVLSTLLKLPDIIMPSTEMLNDEEWEQFTQVLKKAIRQLNDHRQNEGPRLNRDLSDRITNIQMQQKLIAVLEPNRRIKIKEGLRKVLEDNVGKENYDPNRLEHELIYFIEKIDLTEEQVRLANHCEYFLAVLKEKNMSKGKKFSFILQ